MSMPLRLTFIALILFPSCLQAGVYSPEEKCPFKIRADGTAEDLSFDDNGFGQYKLLLGQLGDIGTTPPRPTPPARKLVLERIARLEKDPSREREPAKLAGLAVDLIWVRNLDAALNTLALKSRDRNPDFRVLATVGPGRAEILGHIDR